MPLGCRKGGSARLKLAWMTRQYRSPVMARVHETAEGLRSAGVMDKQTMRECDERYGGGGTSVCLAAV